MTATSLRERPAFGARTSAVGDRTGLARLVLGGCLALLTIAAFASLAVGAVSVPLGEVAAIVTGAAPEGEFARSRVIVLDIRLPRMAMGVLVGASLALSGAMMQGLFRNPLADPGIVGVSAGAAFAAVLVIVLGGPVAAMLPQALRGALLPVAAFAGGLVTTFLLYRLATRHGRTHVATMLLAGIALASLTGAATGLLVFVSDDSQLRQFTFWSLGSLGGATWEKTVAAAPFAVVVVLAAPRIARGLNALALGEAEAFHLGIEVQSVKRVCIVLVAASVGAAVAVSGVIGFVGLVVPHLLRLAMGPDHRYLLPGSALLGASLVLCADMAARVVVAPAELPIGIVTALFGAPFFLWLLLRRRGALAL